jgi:hypothetical protein
MTALVFLIAALFGAPSFAQTDIEARFDALLADVVDTDLGNGVHIAGVKAQTHRATVTLETAEGRSAGRPLIQHRGCSPPSKPTIPETSCR